MKKINIKKTILNSLTLCGKKELAEKIFKQICKQAHKVCLKNYNEIIKLAIINSIPLIISKSYKKKMSKKQDKIIFTFILKPHIRIKKAVKNIIKTSKELKKFKLNINLKNELFKSAKNVGDTIKQKNFLNEEISKTKVYTRFKWHMN